jgi:hypothetical protein
MNPSGIKNRLGSLTKGLGTRWDETQNYWNDPKSREFEQRYMSELIANVDKAVTVLEKLDEILAKVRKDCE